MLLHLVRLVQIFGEILLSLSFFFNVLLVYLLKLIKTEILLYLRARRISICSYICMFVYKFVCRKMPMKTNTGEQILLFSIAVGGNLFFFIFFSIAGFFLSFYFIAGCCFCLWHPMVFQEFFFFAVSTFPNSPNHSVLVEQSATSQPSNQRTVHARFNS